MDNYKKVKKDGAAAGDAASPAKVKEGGAKSGSGKKKREHSGKDDDDYTTMTEKIKAKEKAMLDRKKKSMVAWGTTDGEKSYGKGEAVSFAIKKLWEGGWKQRFLFLFNILLVTVIKFAGALNPLVLMMVINAIVC